MSSTALPQKATETLLQQYRRVRQASVDLAAPLCIEDMVVQSMPDASPTRWHLAHTTWFFEHFLLSRLEGFKPFRPSWDYLFNSYYYSIGEMFKRPQRGLLSRPTVAEVLEYREVTDKQMAEMIQRFAGDEEFRFLVTLGLNHEQQHQELMLTDIKHALYLNPLKPAYRSDIKLAAGYSSEMQFQDFPGGIMEIGADGQQFCFDNETPRHRVLVNPFSLASRPVNNAEFREFVEDGGYRRPELWLSDGWVLVLNEQWQQPLYWSKELNSEFSLAGEIELDPHRTACHISYFEADAYARWVQARLPTEAEWEVVASGYLLQGNTAGSGQLHPGSPGAGDANESGDSAASQQPGMQQLFGDVWEWTRSAYEPYPGFSPLAGTLGEYNGKFMCSQLVLRGGSCVTPDGHVRASYRNFFYPAARWQFSGIRLAKDL